MHWLLDGVCVMALVHLSASLSPASVPQGALVTQKPRFYGVKASRSVVIHCLYPLDLPLQVDWSRCPISDLKAEEPVSPKANVVIKGKTKRADAYLFLKNLTPEDSGVYYCKVNGTRGPGTGLQVMKNVDVQKLETRSFVKDVLIILQALLLASCLVAPLLRRRTLAEKEEAIYVTINQEHIYEGLVVETCEGALYEDISAYAIPNENDAMAPWEN